MSSKLAFTALGLAALQVEGCGLLNIACVSGFVCQNDVCVLDTTTPSTCGGATCADNEICTLGVCLPNPINPTPDTSGCGILNVKCADTETCKLGVCVDTNTVVGCGESKTVCAVGEACRDGTCKSISGGDNNGCGLLGIPCVAGTECREGFCVPSLQSPCDPACSADESCVPVLGATATSTSFTCWGATSTCDACTATEFCNFGVCSPWIQGVDQSWEVPFANTDIDTKLLTQGTTMLTDTTNLLTTQVNGAVLQIDNTLTTLPGLDFPCATTEECEAAAAALILDSTVSIDDLKTQFNQLAVFLGNQADTVIKQMQVEAGAQAEFSVDQAASLVMNNLQLAQGGSAIFSGAGEVKVTMDSAVDQLGLLRMSGGVTLSGETGAATVEVFQHWSNAASATVSDLVSSGNWIGTGTVTVEGALQLLESRLMESALDISAAGSVKVVSTDFKGGDVSIQANGQLIVADNSGKTEFGTVAKCDGVITFQVQDLANLASGEVSDVIKFAQSTDTSAFSCSVQITDVSGASMEVTLDSALLAKYTQTGGARRLLSDHTGNCAYGAWGEGSLQVTTGECGELDGAAQVQASQVLIGTTLLALSYYF